MVGGTTSSKQLFKHIFISAGFEDFFLCEPAGEMVQFDEYLLQMGWFTHRPWILPWVNPPLNSPAFGEYPFSHNHGKSPLSQ